MTRYDAVIVGAGHAGAHAAIALRQAGFAGSVAMIGAEPELPYERPPLSKDYLAGTRPFERLLIRPAAFWPEHGIELRLGEKVVAVDAARRSVTLSDGEPIGFGDLVWAAGGAARRLSCEGHALDGVHLVRTRGDVDALRADLVPGRRVAIVGGGYVGLEVAAALVGLGAAVTVLEQADRVLARVTGEPMSRFFEAEHRARGVDLRLGATVTAILGEGGRAAAVRLGDGSEIPADLVVVGIGIAPAVAPLLAAGAKGGDGVLVDAACRTTLPHIFAIGDCAAHPNRYAEDRVVRIESVQNAADQARVAAAALCGQPAQYHALPWFWSNQYDLRLQTAGLHHGYDAIVVRGEPASRAFSLIYLRGGTVAAVDAVGRPRDFTAGRAIVGRRLTASLAQLSDPEYALKNVCG